MSERREAMLAKIKALLAKTQENGCTEAEAMAALDKARALMDAYEVTEDDLREAEAEGVVDNEFKEAHDPWSIRELLASSVSAYAGTKSWRSTNVRRYHSCVRFCGLREDVELAEWLLDSLGSFVTRELTAYMLTVTERDRNRRRRFTQGFVRGCVRRIGERLRELAARNDPFRSQTANALVACKNQLIDARLAELGLRKAQPSRVRINMDGVAAGTAAGNRATFNRPVGSGGHKMIGSK